MHTDFESLVLLVSAAFAAGCAAGYGRAMLDYHKAYCKMSDEAERLCLGFAKASEFLDRVHAENQHLRRCLEERKWPS